MKRLSQPSPPIIFSHSLLLTRLKAFWWIAVEHQIPSTPDSFVDRQIVVSVQTKDFISNLRVFAVHSSYQYYILLPISFHSTSLPYFGLTFHSCRVSPSVSVVFFLLTSVRTLPYSSACNRYLRVLGCNHYFRSQYKASLHIHMVCISITRILLALGHQVIRPIPLRSMRLFATCSPSFCYRKQLCFAKEIICNRYPRSEPVHFSTTLYAFLHTNFTYN